MKKIFYILLAIAIIGSSSLPTAAQETQEKESDEISVSSVLQQRSFIYNPAGRRDPFRNLLSGADLKEGMAAGGISQMSIDDLILIGIIKFKGKLSGIIKGPQGFPYQIITGDKFEDGFVLSIRNNAVVFRKTKERGFPLYKPRDITKEINPEER